MDVEVELMQPAREPAGEIPVQPASTAPSTQPTASSEQEYRTIFEESLDVQMVIEPVSGRIAAVNQAAIQLLGYIPSYLVGLETSVLFPPQATHTGPEWLEQLRTYGAVFAAQEFRRADGGRAFLDVIVKTIPWRGADAVLVTLRDGAARRQAEEQRSLEDRHVLESQRLESMSILAGGVAHQFNNLLTVMLGNVLLAKMDASDSHPITQSLTQVEQAARQAALICQQMLAFGGRGPISLRADDLSAAIRQEMDALTTIVNAPAVLRFDLHPKLPAALLDRAQLRQVLVNLVTNAAEAIAHLGGSVQVSTGQCHADRAYLARTVPNHELPAGNFVFLEVTDNGQGIPFELQRLVLEPFYTTKAVGRGLGLPATVGIIRRHGGTLRIESRPGAGTTVRVLFPCVDRAETVATLEQGSNPEMECMTATVLVMDDEDMVRNAIGRMLDSSGLGTIEAGTSEEGLRWMRQQPGIVDLVLLDASMPGVRDTGLLTEMRRLQPEVPLVLMSGFTESEVSHGIPAGVIAGFVAKPFTPELILQAIREFLPTSVIPPGAMEARS